jgi:hypothetical protein
MFAAADVMATFQTKGLILAFFMMTENQFN